MNRRTHNSSELKHAHRYGHSCRADLAVCLRLTVVLLDVEGVKCHDVQVQSTAEHLRADDAPKQALLLLWGQDGHWTWFSLHGALGQIAQA